jgi:hypothetical protein
MLTPYDLECLQNAILLFLKLLFSFTVPLHFINGGNLPQPYMKTLQADNDSVTVHNKQFTIRTW